MGTIDRGSTGLAIGVSELEREGLADKGFKGEDMSLPATFPFLPHRSPCSSGPVDQAYFGTGQTTTLDPERARLSYSQNISFVLAPLHPSPCPVLGQRRRMKDTRRRLDTLIVIVMRLPVSAP